MTRPLYTIGFSIAILLFVSCGSSKKSGNLTGGEIIVGQGDAEPVKKTAKTYKAVQIKYASLLQTSPEDITNIKLYQFIDQWMGTPYQWGGNDKKGIDCSAFVQRLLDTGYNIAIPRTSIEQFFAEWIERFASKKHLAEGDLVFFATFGDNAVSHVGMYLRNGQFINSSSSKGVSLGDLKDPYWKSRYVAAGRVKLSMINRDKARK